MQDFSTRFNKVYNYIPTKIKTPPWLALLHYPNGFDVKLDYQLRERSPTTSEDVQKNVVVVEANLLNEKAKMKAEKSEVKDKASSSPYNKLEVMVKEVETLVEIWAWGV